MSTALRLTFRRLVDLGTNLVDPSMWPPRRIVGESFLCVLLALLAAGVEVLKDSSTIRVVAVAVAAGLLSVLRRVVPGTVLTVTVVGSVEQFAFAPLIFVASWSAGRRITRIGRAISTFALACVLTVGLSVIWELPYVSLPSLVFYGLSSMVAIFVPGLAARYWSQRRELAETFREYHTQLLRQREMVAERARIRERQRIAQDMHDSLGHQLALISVHIGALEVDRDLTARQRRVVTVLREASVAAMHELREVVGLMQDGIEALGSGNALAPTTGASQNQGFEAIAQGNIKAPLRGVAGVEGLAVSSRGVGASVELQRSGEVRRLAPSTDHAVYRMVQEGLTNIHKHAPGAAITIELRYERDALVVEVSNGAASAGPNVKGRVVSGGQGLTGLRERARLIGGAVHAGPTVDGGFKLEGVFPYLPPEQGDSIDSSTSEQTLVGLTSDLRQWTGVGSFNRDDFDIDQSAVPKELLNAVNGSKRKKVIVIGCGVAAFVALGLVAAVVLGVIYLAGEGEKSMIEPKQFNALTVGQPEAELRKQLPNGDSFLAEGLRKGAPPEPPGAKCLTLGSTEQDGKADTITAYRFCFKDGKLIEKKSYEVKS
ncbi:histidine kinase [Streptomyces sp. NPDC019396]|uniref:sensor histidine kinase n=1 Tax=Streptomyces sp. NPDC019396 TaxID=3154687 RepID=UPI0033E3EBE1